MTDGWIIANANAWANTFGDLKLFNEYFEQEADQKIKTKLFNKVVKIQEALLDMAAPDINAVIEKLLILWEEDVWAETADGGRKATIIGDLRRLDSLKK
jgi:hypothetical protein